MLEFLNRSGETEARAYCLSIGADPDEIVRGYDAERGRRVWTAKARWQWYLGVSEAGLKRPY